MSHNLVTTMPDSYKDAACPELQGTVVEMTYRVGNYIDPMRKLVTDRNICSAEAGRETVEGKAITKVCSVYLPKDYDKNNKDKKYNVLYLLHGVGGNRFEWLTSGADYSGKSGKYTLQNIFDNLIANGDIEPMIVVVPEGRSAHDWTDNSFNTEGTHLLGFYYFDYELRYDLIPFIESEFNALANIKDTSPDGIAYNRLHRAIGGLSMGGMQALNLIVGGYRCDSTLYTRSVGSWDNGLDATVPAPGMLDLFAYVGAFSNAPTSSDGNTLGKSIASCGHKLQLLYMTCGDADGVSYDIGYNKAIEGLAETAGTKLVDFRRVVIKDGVHDFNVWNNGVCNFARLAFNEPDPTAQLPNGQMFEFWEVSQKYDREIHVDAKNPCASDSNDGTAAKPMKTINAAAAVATPGTRVLIHGGTYRETVQPAMGGLSPEKMISYEAFEGEEAIIKASVEVKDFKPSTGWRMTRGYGNSGVSTEGVRIWEIELDPEEFKGYNPFCSVNILHDRLFIEYDKTDMTTYLNRRGMVFVDDRPMKQVALYPLLTENENSYWVEANGQKVHIRLNGDDDPKNHVIELSNREQCFAPKVPFLSYIRVKGLTMAHAATGAPVPQRGSLSCYRGHHWIIEDCTIDWSNATGIDCGNECWHHTYTEGQTIGNTIIRRNTIKDVGVCGIAGLFVKNMLIEDNLITGTGWQRMELSWEAGGIKVHNSVNSLIRRNIIRECYGCDALWMDVANHNNRITSNLFLDGINSREHIFIECTRDDENLIDNNIIWNVEGRYDKSKIPAEPGSSGWYKTTETEFTNGYGIYLEGTDRLRIVNNLIGKCNKAGFFAKVVAFRLQPYRGGTSREHKFFNNIFYQCGEAAIILPNEHNKAEGNAYAKMPGGYLRVMYPEPEMCLDLAAWQEFCGFDRKGCNCAIDISVNSDTLTMEIQFKTALPEVEPDKKVTTDYFGNATDGLRIAGPFTGVENERVCLSIDPRKQAAL